MKPVQALLAVLALGVLAGCAADYVPKAEPSFYRNLAQPGARARRRRRRLDDFRLSHQ